MLLQLRLMLSICYCCDDKEPNGGPFALHTLPLLAIRYLYFPPSIAAIYTPFSAHFSSPLSPSSLARVLVLEDLADVQASPAQRLTELEHRVFLLEQRLSLLEATLPRTRRTLQ